MILARLKRLNMSAMTVLLLYWYNSAQILVTCPLKLPIRTFCLSLSWKYKIYVFFLIDWFKIYCYSICSLQHINVAMVTILKNVTNVITALGETYLFDKHHDTKVWTALMLMVNTNFHLIWNVQKCNCSVENFEGITDTCFDFVYNVFSVPIYCIKQACRCIDIEGTKVMKSFLFLCFIYSDSIGNFRRNHRSLI
jgi:hypothetical protein